MRLVPRRPEDVILAGTGGDADRRREGEDHVGEARYRRGQCSAKRSPHRLQNTGSGSCESRPHPGQTRSSMQGASPPSYATEVTAGDAGGG